MSRSRKLTPIFNDNKTYRLGSGFCVCVVLRRVLKQESVFTFVDFGLAWILITFWTTLGNLSEHNLSFFCKGVGEVLNHSSAFYLDTLEMPR